MIGASAGALATYAKYRALLGECRDALQLTNDQPTPPADTILHFGMQAMIVGSDPEVFAIFRHIFHEKGITAQKCSLEAPAVTQLSSRKFEAIIVDFDNVPDAAEILSSLSSPNKNAVVIAIASTITKQEAASRRGASFVVARPLVPTEIRTLLRAAYGRMVRDGQSYFRFSYELPVSIRRSSGALIQCSSINLSQSGMAVIAPCSFLVGEEITIAFAIPNTDIFVSADGKIIWDDKHGKAGIKFDCSSASIQERYFDWLQDHFFMTRDADAAQVPVLEQAGYARSRLRKASTVAICLVCLGFAPAFPRTVAQSGRRQAVHIRGRVLDGNTRRPLEAARVLLLPDTDNAWRTDSGGRFSFWTLVSKTPRIQVQCDGYEQISVPLAHRELHDIVLVPLRAGQNGAQLSNARNVNLWLPPSPSVVPAIVIADSGPKVSGTGRNWSHWYQLGVGKAPSGYTVQRAEFWLSGDRNCGLSAQCREIARNNNQAVWEFRLRGHDEPGAPSSTYSVAHIRVLYRSANSTQVGTTASVLHSMGGK